MARRLLCAFAAFGNSTSPPFIDTARIIHSFGTCREYEGCRMQSVMQGRPEFTGDPFDNQRGEMTVDGVGVTSDRLHRPVEVVSMERVD